MGGTSDLVAAALGPEVGDVLVEMEFVEQADGFLRHAGGQPLDAQGGVALGPAGGTQRGGGVTVDVVEHGVAVDQDGAGLQDQGGDADQRVDRTQAVGVAEDGPGEVGEGDCRYRQGDGDAADERGVVLADQG